MKRALFAALALSAISAPASSQVVDSGFNATQLQIDRGAPYAIRSCQREFGGSFSDVCYNQVTNSMLWLGPLPSPLTRSKERVVQVKCDRRVDYNAGSTRGKIAAEYCPKVVTLPNILSIAAD